MAATKIFRLLIGLLNPTRGFPLPIADLHCYPKACTVPQFPTPPSSQPNELRNVSHQVQAFGRCCVMQQTAIGECPRSENAKECRETFSCTILIGQWAVSLRLLNVAPQNHEPGVESVWVRRNSGRPIAHSTDCQRTISLVQIASNLLLLHLHFQVTLPL